MRKTLLFFSVVGVHCIASGTSAPEADEWDLAASYEAATHIFYGELRKILPKPDFTPGVMGVDIHEFETDTLNLEPIVWPEAKELHFNVEASFKGSMPERFMAYRPDPHPDLWIHLVNAAGDVMLAKPQQPDPLIEKLQPDDKGLFFIRFYSGSRVPVLDYVRLAQAAIQDIALLRAYQSADNTSLQAIIKQAEVREAARARREAKAVRTIEDDYYKILRIQELKIRKALLKGLVERLGFEGRWNYYTFKERYIDQHGGYIESKRVPSRPTDPREKLWHDISGELEKIETILEVRKSKS